MGTCRLLVSGTGKGPRFPTEVGERLGIEDEVATLHTVEPKPAQDLFERDAFENIDPIDVLRDLRESELQSTSRLRNAQCPAQKAHWLCQKPRSFSHLFGLSACARIHAEWTIRSTAKLTGLVAQSHTAIRPFARVRSSHLTEWR